MMAIGAGLVFAAAFACVAAFMVLGDTSSGWFIGSYIFGSLAAWALSRARPDWAGRTKWAWFAMSVVMILAILKQAFDGLEIS